MRYIKSKIRISRPLLFLCGPYVNKYNNRRQILSDYIRNNYGGEYEKINKFRPVPFIVDDIFNEFRIGRYELNLSLLEEIVALISFSSYIYLDTLSTSMELGLFSNNLVKNEIRVLTPHEDILNFEKRPPVGKFIDLSVDSTSKNIKRIYYDCKINEHGHVSFDKDKLPKNITDLIQTDVDGLKEYISSDIIFRNSDHTPINLGEISYQVAEDFVVFNFEFKTLFYYVLEFAEDLMKNKEEPEFTQAEITSISNKISSEILELFLLQDIAELSNLMATYIFNKPLVKIRTIHDYDFFDLIRHMLSIVKFIEIANKKNRNAVKTIGYSNLKAIKESMYFNFSGNRYPYTNIMDVFNLDGNDVKTIISYNNNQDKYVRVFRQTINSKIRKITTYSDNKYGISLRKLHTKLLLGFDRIAKYSTVSYGFKKGSSIQQAAQMHLDSISFIKLDIKDFYASIKYRNLYKVIRAIFDEEPNNRYIESFVSPKKSKYINWKPLLNYKYDVSSSRVPLTEILKTMFYKYKLPFGFITSPKLSDIYLTFVDKSLIKHYANLRITRYADDILISSVEKNVIFSDFYSFFVNNLKYINLEFNKKKTIIKSLDKNDSIRFLGLNIVNRGKKNEITISKKYLVETSKIYKKYLLKSPDFSPERFIGRVSHIRFSSKKSYDKFVNIIKVKTGINFDYKYFLSISKFI